METILVCLKIFLARILDVSISTIRLKILNKDKYLVNFVLAFLEVLIWFFIAREALVTEYEGFLVPLFYSLGYACGSLLGSYLSNKVIKGNLLVQIIINKNESLFDELKKRKFAYSYIDVKSSYGNKKVMILVEIKNRSLKELESIIKKYDSFVIISDTKKVINGYIK